MTTRDKGITLPVYSYYLSDITGLSVTPTAADYTVQSATRYGPAAISFVQPVNTVLTVPSDFTVKAQASNAAFAAIGGSVVAQSGAGSVGNSSGNLRVQDNTLVGGAWNTAHLQFGPSIHLWFDAVGRLRTKFSTPTTDTDGIVAGFDYITSAVYDPANLIAGAGVTTTIAVAGAVLGDMVLVSFSLDLQSILLTAYVSVANVVSCRFQNQTGGAIDLASGTIKVKVIKQ